MGYDLGGTEPDGGQPCTLLPDERASGWLGRVRLLGGNPQLRIGAELGAEEQQGRAAIAFRLSLHTGF